MATWIGLGALATLLAVASVIDLRTRTIPNAWVVAGALLGLGLQAALPAGQGLFDASAPGAIGLSPALLAAVALLLAGLLLWRVRVLGAGDAKLLAAVGPYIGPAGVLPVLLYTLLAGGALALATAAWTRLRAAHASGELQVCALQLPYALAITAGVAAYVGPFVWAGAAAGSP